MTGWLGIARFGLVQAALGAIVVLTTSTINRVMIVELALPAMVPGLLVTWHYALQVLRPSWGHGSDKGGRRTPWIIAGMGTLALGGFGAALSVHLMAQDMLLGSLAAIVAFTLIGAGVYSLYKERALLSMADMPLFGVGFAVSFLAAWLCIRWLLKFIANHSFVGFAYYRIAFGIVVLVTAHFNWVAWSA